MPNKSTINFSTILKRSTCLNSSVNLNENSSNYLDKIYDTLLDSIGNSKDGKDYTIQNNINSFIEAMSNRDSATNQYWKPLKVLSELNSKEFNNVASMFNHHLYLMISIDLILQMNKQHILMKILINLKFLIEF